MAGTIALPPSELERINLRELLIRFETHLLNQWDHTAPVLAQINTLTTVVHNALSKKKSKVLGVLDFHPFRESTTQKKLILTPDNFHILKDLAAIR